MPTRQRLVIVTASTGDLYGRVDRFARTFASRGHEVTVVARWRPGLADAENHPAGFGIIRLRGAEPRVAQRGRVGRLVRWTSVPVRVWRLWRASIRLAPAADLYIAMALLSLPTALGLGRRHGARTIYDSADIYLATTAYASLPRPILALLASIERRLARRAARVVTANDDYARLLARRLGVRRPLVVMNCQPRRALPPERRRRFHELLGLPATQRIVLYHGAFAPERGIEQLVVAIRDVPAGDLVLMGYGPLEAELRAAIGRSEHEGRVHLVAAVPPADVVEWVAAADVAAMPIQPTTLNHRCSTPQKLFEAMAAGTPVLAGDLPGMARLVSETGCGLLCDPRDPADIAARLREMLDAPEERRRAWGEAGMTAVANRYHWEAQAEKLLELSFEVTRRPW